MKIVVLKSLLTKQPCGGEVWKDCFVTAAAPWTRWRRRTRDAKDQGTKTKNLDGSDAMTAMPITLGAAGILGLIYAVLTFCVFAARFGSRVGDGGNAPGGEKLQIAVRAQANFAEYVPLILLLLGAAELQHASRHLLLVLAAVLIIARIIHPIGLASPAPNLLRGGGAMLTVTVLIVASLTAIAVAF
jgi:uncharacterized protein